MSDIAIRVENLGKQYRIGALQKNGGHYTYKSLRDSIASAASAPFRAARALMGRNDSETNHDEDTIWALKDVSFDVKHGDIVGVIGRNGAGKSTLLKILSRITEPTTGHIEIRGRVGSLLEVGTGFHPELTGRDNVYLNGSILGMKNAEIAKNFDAIVAFAEVEKFIDTPVKHYSSGMYLRLAFAVAAHLQTEILIVDEVLAVGDIGFQRKCLGKMGEVAKQGRTVLFVSHNLPAISNLCVAGMLLDQGRLTDIGEISEIVRRYVTTSSADIHTDLSLRTDRKGIGLARFTEVSIHDLYGGEQACSASGETLAVRLHYRSSRDEPLRNCRVSLSLHDMFGQVLFLCSTELTSSETVNLPSSGIVQFTIPRLPLTEGQYSTTVFLEVDREVQDWIENASKLNVVDGDFYGSGRLYPPGWKGKGVLVDHSWSILTGSLACLTHTR